MPRGRPIKSLVREHIIEILYFLEKAYGYDIYKHYIELFPKTTMRNVYYHLKKGLALKELEIDSIEKEKGDYSWGSEVEKVYYKIGPNANPKVESRVKKYFENIKK
jgi:hypothetical protein